jgi:hypothetical protein
VTPLLVPSYSRKLSWAEKHLENLEGCVGEFRDRHPYRARKVAQGQQKGQWILEFTEDPDPDWSLLVGDVLYNLEEQEPTRKCRLSTPIAYTPGRPFRPVSLE